MRISKVLVIDSNIKQKGEEISFSISDIPEGRTLLEEVLRKDFNGYKMLNSWNITFKNADVRVIIKGKNLILKSKELNRENLGELQFKIREKLIEKIIKIIAEVQGLNVKKETKAEKIIYFIE